MRKLKGKEERILWRLPFIIPEAEIPFYREAASHLAGYGFRRFEAANLGHFQLLKGLEVEISTDYRLFSLNTQAILAWQELGAKACTLYIEDDADNMAELLAAPLAIPRRVLMYGGVPVITTKIRIKDVKGDAPLMSDRGDGYTTAFRDGLTVVTPTTPFSLTGFKRRLQDMGCDSFIVDLCQLPGNDWPRVLDAFARGTALPETSEFNFHHGLGMSFFDKLKTNALLELVKDPRVKDLVTRREFRITEEDLRKEFVSRVADEELQELEVVVGEAFLEISGKMKKKLLPFAIPFSARFSLHSLEFSPRGKTVHLRLEELKPVDLDWLTKRLVEKIPFLSFADGLVTVHLVKIPRLTPVLTCQVKGFKPFDHVVLKDLRFVPGEVVGRVGVML